MRKLIHSSSSRRAKGHKVDIHLTIALLLVFAALVSARQGAGASGVSLADSPIYGDVETLGLSTYSGTYLGASLVDNATQLDVYLTSLSPQVERAFEALTPSVPMNFVLTGNSEATLANVQEQITTAAPSLEAQGIQLQSWGGGLNSGGKIVISVLSPSTSQIQELYSDFGSTAVEVDAVQTPGPVLLSNRIADSSPWTGSDSLGSNYNPSSPEGCSSGFGIDSLATVEATLTDAHCFPLNGSVTNEILNVSPPPTWNPSSGFGTVGTVTFQDRQNNSVDSEVINAVPSGYVWGGAIGSPVKIPVDGYTNNPNGDYICVDGTYDGEWGSNSSPAYCGAGTGSGLIQIIDNGDEDGSLGYCMPADYATSSPPYEVATTECHLILADSLYNDPVVGGGDSGGPVFRFTNSGANMYAIGVIEGGSNVETCHYNAVPNRYCYSHVWYTSMSSTLSYWEASIVTAG